MIRFSNSSFAVNSSKIDSKTGYLFSAFLTMLARFSIKRSYNSFANEMNTRMQIYMRAQKQIEEAMQRLSKLANGNE